MRSSTPKILPAGMDQFLIRNLRLLAPLFYIVRRQHADPSCGFAESKVLGPARIAGLFSCTQGLLVLTSAREYATLGSAFRIIAAKYRSRPFPPLRAMD